MQQIKIDAVGLEPLQAPLAGGDGPGAGRILGQHLADDEAFVAPPGHRLGDHLLGAAIAVHLGGVDQRHAEIEPELQRRHLVLARPPAFAHMPGALAELRHFLAGGKRHGGDGALCHETPVQA